MSPLKDTLLGLSWPFKATPSFFSNNTAKVPHKGKWYLCNFLFTIQCAFLVIYLALDFFFQADRPHSDSSDAFYGSCWLKDSWTMLFIVWWLNRPGSIVYIVQERWIRSKSFGKLVALRRAIYSFWYGKKLKGSIPQSFPIGFFGLGSLLFRTILKLALFPSESRKENPNRLAFRIKIFCFKVYQERSFGPNKKKIWAEHQGRMPTLKKNRSRQQKCQHAKNIFWRNWIDNRVKGG